MSVNSDNLKIRKQITTLAYTLVIREVTRRIYLQTTLHQVEMVRLNIRYDYSVVVQTDEKTKTKQIISRMASQELSLSQGLSQVLSQDDFVSDSDSSATDAPKNAVATERSRRKTSPYEDSDCETRLSDSAEEGDVVTTTEETNKTRINEEINVVDFRVRDPAACLSEEEAEEEIAHEPLGSTEETLSEASVADLLETETPIVSGGVNEGAVTDPNDRRVPAVAPVASNESKQADTTVASAPAAAADEPAVVKTGGETSDAEMPLSHLEPTLASNPEPASELSATTSTSNDDQVVDQQSSPIHEDAAVQPGDHSRISEDTPAITSKQLDPAATSEGTGPVGEQPVVPTTDTNCELEMPPYTVEPSDASVSAPPSSPPTSITTNNNTDGQEQAGDHSSRLNENATSEPSDSSFPADTPATKSEQPPASPTISDGIAAIVGPAVMITSVNTVNEPATLTSNQEASSGSVLAPSNDQQHISPSSKNHLEQAADSMSAANRDSAASRVIDVPVDTSMVTAKQVDSIAEHTGAAAVDEPPVVATNAINTESEAAVPSSSLEPSNTSALPLIGATSNPEPAVEGSSQPPAPVEQPRSLKRYASMNHVQLKKQKLALENLKLALELGVITRAECIEKGRLVVTQASG